MNGIDEPNFLSSLYFKDFIYLFMRHTQRERERERERGRDIGRGRGRLLTGSLMQDQIRDPGIKL